MAIKLVFAVRDRAADSFGQPFFDVARGRAIRSFTDELNKNENSPLSAHPEDFDLYFLGMFNDQTGMFETGVPEMIAIGKDMKQD